MMLLHHSATTSSLLCYSPVPQRFSAIWGPASPPEAATGKGEGKGLGAKFGKGGKPSRVSGRSVPAKAGHTGLTVDSFGVENRIADSRLPLWLLLDEPGPHTLPGGPPSPRWTGVWCRIPL
jgi:hypothetical protein